MTGIQPKGAPMATNFPTSLDSFTNPSSSDLMNSATVPHAAQHGNINDAVEALEAKVGVNGSAVTTSLDYKVTNGIHSALNVDSGVLYVDASNNRVGVNTTSPTEALQVEGTIKQVSGGSGDFSYMTLNTSALSLTGDNTDSLSASPSSVIITSNDLNDVNTMSASAITMVRYSPSYAVTQIDNDGNIAFPGVLSGGTMLSLKERWNVVASYTIGTINVDIATSNAWFYTVNSQANFTLNIRYDSSTSLASKVDVGDSITVAFANTNGAGAYYPSTFQIDGSAVTPIWQGGTAPTGGNASSVDMYVYTIVKTASTPTYTVFASQNKFA